MTARRDRRWRRALNLVRRRRYMFMLCGNEDRRCRRSILHMASVHRHVVGRACAKRWPLRIYS